MNTFPKLGDTLYRPETMLPLIESLFREGASIEEVAYEMNIGLSTLYDWTSPKSTRFKPELLEAIKKGVEVSQGWWKKQGRVNLHSQTFNPSLWYMNMKNRFGWSDNLATRQVGEEGFVKESAIDRMEKDKEEQSAQ